jgi:hypothetical protein
MLWKLLGLQKKLDALFDDGWVTLCISSRNLQAGCDVQANILATSMLE